MTRPAAAKAAAAADAAAAAVLEWLRTQPVRSGVVAPASTDKDGQPKEDGAAEVTTRESPVPNSIELRSADQDRPLGGTTRDRSSAGIAETFWLPNPDWLYHRLAITGPAEELARFRNASAGAGLIPWRYDLERMEADYFHLLIAPQPRELSLAGARIFARQLRDAVGRRHELAVSLVGQSRACPFDLHALVPVPADVLALGPDEPAALAWLWEHWGTTQALRHVAVEPAPEPDASLAGGTGEVRLSFWSADWTPWRALGQIGSRWSALRFEIRPSYDLP